MDRTKLKAWFFLFRPWSYTATTVPFLVAAALVAHTDPEYRPDSWLRWALGLLSGFLFHSTVNLLNTWGDERSGVDDVPGAIRTTPQVHEGLVTMRAVFTVAAICTVLAVALGCALCFYKVPSCVSPTPTTAFCCSLLGAGILGALGSTNYSSGVKFKYHGLGVPFVSCLMGPIEIFVAFALAAPYLADRLVGKTFAPTLHFFEGGSLASLAVLLTVSLPVALLVGVIMHGNDMRDIPTDRAAGIKTFASWMGPKRALGYYRFCHIGAYVFPVVFAVAGFFTSSGWRTLFFLLPLLVLPLSVRTLKIATRVYHENPECPKWRGLERGSGGIHFLFGVLYAFSLFLASGSGF